jgi:hypothetical protein
MGDLNKSEKGEFLPSVMNKSDENKLNKNAQISSKPNIPQASLQPKQEIKNNNSLQNQRRNSPFIKKTIQNPGAYPSGKNVRFLEPEIVEKTNWELKHVGFAVILAFILALIQFGVMTFLKLEATPSWILGFILIVIFGIVVYFLIQPKKEKEIRQRIVETELQTIDRPIDREVIRTIEVEKPVIREIPIIKEVPVYKNPRTVYIAKSSKKSSTRRTPSIKYNFIGSKQTKTYHKFSCRLSKTINPKSKVRGPTANYFRRLKYKPCKVCMKR